MVYFKNRRHLNMVIATIILCLFTIMTVSAAPQTALGSNILHLPDAILEREYNTALPLAAAVGKVKSEVVEGQLPKGLETSGIWIKGSPKEIGRFEFKILAIDSLKQRVQQQFLLEVLNPPPPSLVVKIEDTNLPACIVCIPYNQSLKAEGGYPPYNWRFVNGRLPNGLSFDDGQITGNVRESIKRSTTYNITAEVKDSRQYSHVSEFELELVPNPQILLGVAVPDQVEEDSILLPSAVVDQPFRIHLPFVGGFGNINYSLTRGDLPIGIELKDGLIIGTATTCGDNDFTVTVKDSLGQSIQRDFNISTLPPSPPDLRITTNELPEAVMAETLTAVLRAEGGKKPYKWKIVDGTLPEWAELKGDTITGRPIYIDELGQCEFKVQVTDSCGGKDGPVNLSITVKENTLFPQPIVVNEGLPAATVSDYYFGAIAIQGGLPPYTFVFFEQAHPPGLLPNEGGWIAGIPTQEGQWELSVKIRDSLGQESEPKTLGLTVRKAAPHSIKFQKIVPPPAVMEKEYELYMR